MQNTKSSDYLLFGYFKRKVITAYINIVIPKNKDIKENLNASSPYSENTIKNQDTVPKINIAILAPFNSLSTAFFSIITFPLLFDSIHIQVLTFLGGYL